MAATGDGEGHVSRHYSSCGTSVTQAWTLVSVSLVDGDEERSFENRVVACPNCESSTEQVGNFFDHRDGSGRQEHTCTNCDVEIDE